MNFDVEQQGGIQFTVEQPQFKFCKKRKEFFSNEYDPIWYKSPYKYNMRMKVTSSKNCLTDDLFTRLVVTHDDGSAVKFKGETITFSHGTQNYQQQTLAASSVVKSEENQANNSTETVTATPTPTVKRRTKQSAPTRYHELKVGPFQFNVCSYKFDGKKFRLSIHVFQKLSLSATNERQQQEREICVLTSPAFLIKAKKPIAKPGIKSHKRSFDEMNQQQQQASNHQASPPLVIVPGVGGVGGVGGDFCSSPSSPSNSSTHSNHGALGVISSSCPSSPGGSCSSSSSCLSSPPCSPLPPSMFSGGVPTVNTATVASAAHGLSSPTSASAAAAAAAAFYFGGNAGGVAADGNNGNNSATETAAAVAAAALAADNYQMLENQLFQFRYMLNNLIQQQSVIIQQPPSQLSPQHQHQHQHHPQAPGFTPPHLQHHQHHHYDTVVDVNGMNKRMRLSPPHLLEYSTEVAMNPPMMPSMIAPPPTTTTTTAQQQQQQQLFNPYMTTTSSSAIGAANSGLSQQLPPFLPYPVVPSSTMQQQQSNEMSVHSSTSTNTTTTTTTTTTTPNMVGPSLSTTFNSSSSTILPSLAPFDEFGSYLEMDHLPFHDQQQQSISVVGGCGGTTAVSSSGELNALSHHSRGNMMSSFDMMNDHPTRSELVDLEDLLPPSQVFLL